ncbi:MAG: nucleotidyltransferase family protein [Actinomycetales bacterium]|nr:nucleotidyltransferase family protein [Actinomycetales bacterium]
MGRIREGVFRQAQEIKGLLPRNRALDIRVFGSVARAEDRADSDVDFLVLFATGASILDQVHLQRELTELLGCEVDVVAQGGLKERDRHILAEAVPL